MRAPTGRVVVAGLDGTTFDVLRPLVAAGVMPNLGRLLEEGAWGDCASTVPPVTAPAWTTCVTGVNPGRHGVFGFFSRDPQTLAPSYLSSSSVRAPTLWRLLSDAGRSVGIVNFPMSYPPEPVNGFMVSGFLTPKGRPYTHPAALQQELDRTGYLISHPWGSKPVPAPGPWLVRLREVTERRTQTVLELFERERPDLGMVVYMTPDLVQHHFYKYLDPSCPEAASAEADVLRPALHACFGALDEALGALRSSLGPHDLLLVCSDHGFAPLRGRFFLNRWLARRGFLRPRLGALAAHEASRTLHARLPGRGGRWGGPVALRESYLDRRRSSAFGGEPIEFAVWALGPHTPLDDIAAGLLEVTDPDTGERIVEEVVPRERAYQGPWVERAPHLLLRMTGDGYSISNRLWGRRPGVFRRVRRPDGTHSRSGILVAAGGPVRPGVRMDASLQDVAPTVLRALGEPLPAPLDGRVLDELFVLQTMGGPEPVAAGAKPAVTAEADPYSRDEAREIAGRLADLGYID